MKLNILIILLALYSLVGLEVDATDFNVEPSLVWSGANYLNFKNGQILTTIKYSELNHFIDILLGAKNHNSIFQNYFAEHAKPAVVVVFVLPEHIRESLFMRHSPYLRTVLETSVSSVSIPYTQTELLSIDSFSSKLINTLSAKVKKILVANKLGKPLPVSKTIDTISIESILQKDSAAIFEKGLPELVIISLDSENPDIIESVVQKISTDINEKVNGKFVSFLTFTSLTIQHHQMKTFDFTNFFEFGKNGTSSSHQYHSSSSPHQNNSTSFNFAAYWPGYILQGILIAIISLLIFLVGFCCMFAIQTPKSFEEPKGNIQ